MKRAIAILISLVITGSLLCGNTLAQTPQLQLRSRFKTEYEKTDQVIDRAKTVIAESRTERGVGLLNVAIKLQTRARNMAVIWRRYDDGLKLTLSAREKAHGAIMVCRQAEENENLVLKQLEKTDNLIARVQNHLTPNSPRMIVALFDSAKENQRRAWEFFRNRALRPSLKLSRQAEKIVRGLIDRVQSANSETQRLTNRLLQLEQRVEQAQTKVQDCGSDEAARLLKKATESVDDCRRLINSGNVKRAENSMKLALQLLHRVLKLCSDYDALDRMMAQVEREIDRLSETIVSSGQSSAIELLETARKHLKDAEKLCASGDMEGCAANLKVAQMSLRKAKKLAGL